jgi:hypothetical protein
MMTKSGWISYSGLVLAFFSFAIFNECHQRALKKTMDNLAWDARLADHLQTDNFIMPTVGIIQFIKHGRYSVEIEDIKYTGNGLELSGFIGNATPLVLSTLTATFTANRPYYKNRERYLKQRGTSAEWFTVGWGDDEIGKGQVLLEYLGSGSRMPFAVTIPNVKQSSDETELAVSFSGERYTYGR